MSNLQNRVRCFVLSHTDDEDNPSGAPYQRLVTIPPHEWEAAREESTDLKLGLVFQYGQNDFSASNPEHNTTYSLSVGDVILLDGKLYAICGIGFTEITRDQFDSLVATNRRDRTFHPVLNQDNPKLGGLLAGRILTEQLKLRMRQGDILVAQLEQVAEETSQELAELKLERNRQ